MSSDAIRHAEDPRLEDERWRAVRARDPSADGRFVYAVATTGVYCRPSCPSRPARPENVSFHSGPEAARAAGFRACRRCDPDGDAATARHAAIVEAACRRMDEAIDAGDPVPTLSDLAAAAGWTASHFQRRFRAALGISPRQYADRVKAERAKGALARGLSVTDALHDAGYGSSSRFYDRAAAEYGMAPVAWRDGGRGATIRFATGACALGTFLVAATEKGLCAILLGDDADSLRAELRDRFPKADRIAGDADFAGIAARVAALVGNPGAGLDLPLDIRGTAFRQQVWEALRRIPAGRTATYSEVAAALGMPAATRAVAAACAANPVAIAIPCHRVVRADGSLAGYRWGIERKRRLIARERGEADAE